MAKRGLELNTRITALDEASKVVDKVAKKMGDLEDKTHTAQIDADASKAESVVRSLDRRLDGLTSEDRVTVLEVQAKQAMREVDQLTRKLANADKYDDQEINLIVEARDQATKKLQAIKGELDDLQDEAAKTGDTISDEIGGSFDGLGSKFSGIGGKIGGKLAAGFAAAGVGALMSEALQNSWEKAGGIRQITGEFRLSADEAAKFGKIAGELYADNWGDALPEVQRVVALAGQRLEDTTGETLAAISSQILATSQVWGADYESVIRSITQLTLNGLAPSSEAALDLIVTGFQDGGDKAGDLLDTIDEYSQHWAAMGLSGEDALNQIIAGFQGGQRDADKLADAVKEMRLRVVEDSDAISDAYDDLGFNADEMRKKFLKGGDSAREAFLQVLTAIQSVEDPVEQNRLAVELIGTQFEDLGPTAIDALLSVEGQLRQTEGAAQDLANTVGEVSPFEDLTRDAQGYLTTLGDGLAKFVDLDFDGGYGEGLEAARDRLEGTADAADVSADALQEWEQAALRAKVVAKDYADDSTYLASAQGEVAAVTKLGEEATRRKADADEVAAKAAKKHLDSIRNIRDEIGALKREVDDRSAFLDLQDTFDDTVLKMADVEASAREQEQAMLSLKGEVLDYAESINLPDSVVTNIIADIDQGKLSTVEALLERLGNGITLPIRLQVVNTVNAALSSRGVRARVTTDGNLQAFDTGGVVPGPRGSEQLAIVHGGETILPTHKTSLPTIAAGGSPSNVTINVVAPAGANADEFGRKVWEAIRREARWNGPVTGMAA